MNIHNRLVLTIVVLFILVGTRGYTQDLTIKLDPPVVNLLTVGDVCSLDVVIENVTNLGAFQVDLVYSIDSLQADDALMGSFLGSTGRTVLPVGPTIDNTSQPGRITYGGATLGGQPGPDSSGTLATVVFTSMANGNAKLEFQNVQVSDISGQAMTVTVIQPGEVITTVDKPRVQTEIPESFQVFQNYPNPFNPETEIRFELPAASHVLLSIFNTLGQEIRTLVDRPHDAGYHTSRWDGKDGQGEPVSSGVYLYQIKAGEFTQVKKMSLLR